MAAKNTPARVALKAAREWEDTSKDKRRARRAREAAEREFLAERREYKRIRKGK